MVSADPTSSAQRALDALKSKYVDVDIEYVFGSSIKAWLIETPKVRKEYYSNSQDMLEALNLADGNKPIDMIGNGAKRLNNIVLDDRIKATVVTDGECLGMVYTLRPDVKENVPLFRVKSKSPRGYEALKALYKDGTPFSLTSEDIGMKPLIPLLDDFEGCSTITAFSMPEERPGSLLIYPDNVETGCRPLLVTLRTVKCGVEVGVRSNAGQTDCPVLIELKYPVVPNADGVFPDIRLNVRPSYIGCTVKVARKGAMFLRRLGESGKLGLCTVNGDPEDAVYCFFPKQDKREVWENELIFLNALYRVCSFFGVNPVVDKSIETDGFVSVLDSFVGLLDIAGKELQGTLSCTLADVDEERLEKAECQEEVSIVTDESVWIDLFGVHCEATLRFASKGKLAYEKSDEGFSCRIDGVHTAYIKANPS